VLPRFGCNTRIGEQPLLVFGAGFVEAEFDLGGN
jgi:hypothetical protein